LCPNKYLKYDNYLDYNNTISYNLSKYRLSKYLNYEINGSELALLLDLISNNNLNQSKLFSNKSV
jgi:hypothetical protein